MAHSTAADTRGAMSSLYLPAHARDMHPQNNVPQNFTDFTCHTAYRGKVASLFALSPVMTTFLGRGHWTGLWTGAAPVARGLSVEMRARARDFDVSTTKQLRNVYRCTMRYCIYK